MNNYLAFFTVDVWTIIFTWVNMFILFTVMKKLLFKPVSNILDQRDAEIKKIYDDANQANEKAVTLEKEYSEKMAQARDEAGEIIRQATLTAQKREKEI
ncbi:MAG: ATP synthase F0 subunit B, partial [Oscillospiraceae bacterium]|nr:ATP synthase F0 subunit B [Oscillospiraceae bacterium]